MPDYRVLVTGSREFDDYATVCQAIGDVITRLMATAGPYPHVVVVHGDARGADTLAERAARAFGMATEPHPADWEAHGKSAGFKRNAVMVALGADVTLAFYKVGAGNRGTDHCARLAERAAIPVRRYSSESAARDRAQAEGESQS